MAIEAVQKDSTYGSHDRGAFPEEVLTAAIAQATIDKYKQVEAHLGERSIAGAGRGLFETVAGDQPSEATAIQSRA
jgi:hypothetical protein